MTPRRINLSSAPDSPSDIDLALAGSRLLVRRDGARLEVTSRPRYRNGSFRLWIGTALLLTNWIQLLARATTVLEFGLGIATLGIAIGLLAWYFATGCPRVRLTLTKRLLRIEVSNTVRPFLWERGLHQFLMLETGDRLTIVSDDGSLRLTTGLNHAETTLFGKAIGQAMDAKGGAVPSELPGSPEEVPILFAPGHGCPVPGFLGSGPGWLSLRYGFLATPRYVFFSMPDWTWSGCVRALVHHAFPLAPYELTCRPDAEGGETVQIARSAWPRVTLAFWCKDKEALHEALASLWGADAQ